MPTLLQRLSAAARSFRDEIVALRLSIQDQTKAIHESTEASKHRNVSPPILRAELQIPETIKTHKIGDDTQPKGREPFKIRVQTLTLIFVAAYTVITYCSLQESKRFNVAQNRAWVGLGFKGMHIESSSFQDGTKTATATLYYELRNDGHSPANVFIKGNIVEIIKSANQHPDIDWRPEAEAECVEARKSPRYPLTVLPNSETSYGIVYDDQLPNGTTEYMEAIKLEPPYIASKYREFVNFGCIIYQSPGSSDVYQTPFKAFLYRDLSTKEGFTLGGPWVIGNAN